MILQELSAPNMSELPTIARSQRSTIEETLTNARETVIKMTDDIEKNNKVKKDAHLAINQAFQALQQALELRKTTLLSELESVSLSKITTLTLEKEKYEKIEVASRILLTHTDDEIAALGGLIQMDLAAVKKEDPISLLHSDIYVDVQTDGLIGELSKFGCVSDLSLSPSSSTWTSTSVAKVKTDFHVKVQSKTSMGTVYPHGGLQMKAEMKSNNGAIVHGKVEDHGNGTYTTTLIPLTAGPHQLLITLNGQHVQNSPHDLDVLPVHKYHDCSTLGNVQQVINCPKAPFSIAISNNGDLYVATDERCIYLFDRNGYPKKTVGNNGLLFEGGNDRRGRHGKPSLIIKDNILYFANWGDDHVYSLTLDGGSINSFSAYGAAGLLVDEYNRIYVSNFADDRIALYNHNGGKLFNIEGRVTGDHSFREPCGLAFDPLGNIHVAASGSNAIKVFTKEGVYIRKYGDLKRPIGIAIDRDGYIFVTECEGNCFSIFDPEGNKIHTVGCPRHQPFGLALDPRNDSIYIANYEANVVLKYSTCRTISH